MALKWRFSALFSKSADMVGIFRTLPSSDIVSTNDESQQDHTDSN